MASINKTPKTESHAPLSSVTPRTIEFCYKHRTREEVRYRRLEGSEDAEDLIKQHDDIKEKLGDDCPYFYRYVG